MYALMRKRLDLLLPTPDMTKPRVTVGFVYIASTQGVDGLLKVGFTTRSTEERMRELSGPGTPYPFVALERFRVLEPKSVEQEAHRLLSKYRFNKEWFQCTLSQARAAILEAGRDCLLGAASKQDMELADQSFSRWTKKASSLKREISLLETEISMSEHKARREIDYELAEEEQRIVDARQWPATVKYVVLVPSGVLALLAAFATANPAMAVSVAVALGAGWNFLSKENASINKSRGAYKDFSSRSNMLARERCRDALASKRSRLSTAKQHFGIAEAQIPLGLQLLNELRTASSTEQLRKKLTARCSSCQTRFEAYAKDWHVCPQCQEVVSTPQGVPLPQSQIGELNLLPFSDGPLVELNCFHCEAVIISRQAYIYRCSSCGEDSPDPNSPFA